MSKQINIRRCVTQNTDKIITVSNLYVKNGAICPK